MNESTLRETATTEQLQQNLEGNKNLFHYGYSQNGLPVDPAVLTDMPNIQSDLGKVFAGTNIDERHIRVYATEADLEQDLATCKSYTSPDQIPADSSCGWWFVPDVPGPPATFKASFCVPGSSTGPNPRIQGLPTGTWFWDREKAKAAEAKKVCARTTRQSLQDPTQSCAFCEEKGHSVPYDRTTGQLLYDATCTTVRPEPPTSSTTDGCRITTDPAERKTCLLSLLNSLGVSSTGLLYLYAMDPEDPETRSIDIGRLQTLLATLNTRARWRTDVLELAHLVPTGVLDVDGLTRKVRKIVAAQTSYDAIVAGIARHLVQGTPFNSTAYYYETAKANPETSIQSAQNDLALQDLQQEFRKAGCQASGAAYPKELPTSGKSLADMRAEYQTLYRSMQAERDPTKQEEAIRKCLNGALNFEPAATTGPFCNEPGVEYLIYSPIGPRLTLIGRLLSPVGFLGANSSYGEAEVLRQLMRDAPLSDVNTVRYVARTMFSIPMNDDSNILQSTQWALPQQGTYVFRVNGVTQLTGKAGDDAPGIPYTPNQPNLLELEYTVETTDRSQRVLWGTPGYPYMTQNLRQFRLLTESNKPYINFQFDKEVTDANRIATLETQKVQLTPKFAEATTYGITIKEPVRLTPRLRSSMIQIIALRVQLTQASTLFRLKESETYFEQFAIESRKMVYTVFNGNERKEFIGFFPEGLSPFGSSMRVALVFTKSENNLTVQFLYYSLDNEWIALSSDTQTIQGTLGFRRSLELEFQPFGFLQEFQIYDRKSGRAEGFQNPGEIPDILKTPVREYTAESYGRVDASSYVPRTLLRDAAFQRFAGDRQTVQAPMAALPDSCKYTKIPYTPVPGAFQYEDSVKYNAEFQTAIKGQQDVRDSLMSCYTSCRERKDCVGMTYYSDTGSCQQYTQINTGDTVPRTNAISFVMGGQDTSVADLRVRILSAIDAYKVVRGILQESQYTKYTARVITDAELERDRMTALSSENPSCLNAFLQKYTLQTK